MRIFYFVILILVPTSVFAYSLDWKVEFVNNLGGYKDSYLACVGDSATDGLDNLADFIQTPSPGGYSAHMVSLVEGSGLTVDFRSDFADSKIWEITLIAQDPFFVGISGTNNITWTHNLPVNLEGRLIDYGVDENRTSIVNVTDIKSSGTYIFQVSDGLGPYRYIDFVVNNSLKSYNLSLIEGWNLVSIPLVTPNKSVNYFFEGMLVYGYNGSWFAPEEIDGNKGYWVKTNESLNISIMGKEVTNKTIELRSGWNIIGYPYIVDQPPSNIYNRTLFSYDLIWQSFNPNRATNSLDKLKPGYGYWIKG